MAKPAPSHHLNLHGERWELSRDSWSLWLPLQSSTGCKTLPEKLLPSKYLQLSSAWMSFSTDWWVQHTLLVKIPHKSVHTPLGFLGRTPSWASEEFIPMKKQLLNLTGEKVLSSKVSLWKNRNILAVLRDWSLFKLGWDVLSTSPTPEPVNFTGCLPQILISRKISRAQSSARKRLNEALSIYWTSLPLTAAGKRFPLLSSPRGQRRNQNFHECKFQLQLILMTMTSLLYEVHNEPDHRLAKSHDKLQACPSGSQCFLYPRFKQRMPPASAHEEPSSAIDKWLFCFTFFFN